MVAQRQQPTTSVVMEPDEVLSASSGTMLEQQTRGEIDIQIVTARRYPRSIEKFQKQAMSMATLDEDTAASCFYVLPKRKGADKPIEGPSARLAEIIASAWTHMRVVGRVVEEGDRFIVAYGGAWDLEANNARAVEVRRRITGRDGGRYNDDMIGVTANAAIAIATRNAVFQVVPKAHWWGIYLKCREVAVGTAETLSVRRGKMLEYFQKLGVEPARVFGLLEVRGVEDIGLEHLAILKGLATAIKEGDTSIDEAFPSGVGAGAQADPVATELSLLEEPVRASAVALFGQLRMNKGQQLVQLRAFKGDQQKLLATLAAMVDAQKGDQASTSASAPAQRAEVDGETSSASVAPTATAAAAPAPSTRTTPAASAKATTGRNPFEF